MGHFRELKSITPRFGANMEMIKMSSKQTTYAGSPATDSPSTLPDGFLPALNTQQAAEYTGLASATLETLRCRGNGPVFVRYSRRAVRYKIVDLDRWMIERTVANTSMREAA